MKFKTISNGEFSNQLLKKNRIHLNEVFNDQ